MIRQLLRVVGDDYRAPIHRFLTSVVCYAVLQGVTFVLLVPVLRPLLRGDVAGAWPWLGALAVATAATVVAYYVQSLQGFRVGLEAANQLYHRIGDHLATLPLGWFSGGRVGRMAKLASSGVREITGLFAHQLQPLLSGIVTPLTVVLAMFLFDWRLATAMLVAAPVLYLVHRWSVGMVARADQAMDEAVAEANDRIVEFARFQPTLRAFGRVGADHAALEEAMRTQDRVARRYARRMAPGKAVFTVAVQLAVAVAVVFGADLALGGAVDVAELIALLVLVVRFAEPIVEVGELGSVLRSTRASLERMDEVLSTPPLPEPAQPLQPKGSDIELADVRFSYEGAAGRPVLDGVSFRVPAGTMTALVGPSGSGKTTVTRLIARFWDVDSGSVRVGGVDVRELGSESLVAQLAMVFQDVYLFDATIAENIRVGRPAATDDEVREAARLAGVDEIVHRLPQGWDTRVGEGGAALSGGERQRVSLARAILKDAPIVLLDEATAALDPQNEAAVQQALGRMADRTMLVIAHRLQTVVAADQIVVLDSRGRVAEVGTHDELLARDGQYAAFWRERSRAGTWRLRGDRSPSPVGGGSVTPVA
ncbi:ABC transporter ATP-binding protein [Streptoalloteichus hindustanus]|uniref:ATP-binding cassette, subfamily B n=1 Tax=Streptoalloteichus hindustanus TaxID=2017 RepID=A0A1M5L8K8_STRHI|nr:ABC transporter ATP-binding protein [Streptoalloteichus hindustanus]SHG60743.1 ATP-binding cassette, subfamily B [Streptoalloteichus hindustanus]